MNVNQGRSSRDDCENRLAGADDLAGLADQRLDHARDRRAKPGLREMGGDRLGARLRFGQAGIGNLALLAVGPATASA